MIGNSGQMKLKGKFPEIGPFKEKKEEKVGLRVETDISPKKIKAEYFEQQQQKETLR